MRIVLAGGTGHIGAILRRHFVARGYQVVTLTRRPSGSDQVAWDGATLGPWTDQIDGADVVINLAGRTVNCRYNEKNLGEMMASRIDSTRVIGEAIAQSKRPPRVWLQSSTATIYAHRFDAPNDEQTGILGGNELGVPKVWSRSIDIAKAWEAELERAQTPSTRKVAMRMAIAMGPDQGSVFEILSGLARKGLMGRQGSGRQMVSWIHDLDLANSMQFLIDRDDLNGPVNLSSPNPLPQSEFAAAIRKAVGARFGLPAPAPLLDVVAWLRNSHSELLLKSRYVVPTRLLEAGFAFQFPTWSEAAAELAERM